MASSQPELRGTQVHALVARGFGLDPVWHGDRVTHTSGTTVQEVLVDLAGPTYTALSGAMALLAARRARGYIRMLLTWLGVLSVAGMCGYLISGPFATAGDIANVLAGVHAAA